MEQKLNNQDEMNSLGGKFTRQTSKKLLTKIPDNNLKRLKQRALNNAKNLYGQ